jgi:hypothetical protein
MSLSLTFHGAARSVTGSCIHVQAGTTTANSFPHKMINFCEIIEFCGYICYLEEN